MHNGWAGKRMKIILQILQNAGTSCSLLSRLSIGAVVGGCKLKEQTRGCRDVVHCDDGDGGSIGEGKELAKGADLKS